MPTNLDEKVDELAKGVYVIQNVAGQNQNTLAVGFSDYVVAVEAPGSSDGADAVIKKIKELFPGKPIRYVAMTHHHGDHIGGMRSFIAEGATVVTTAANRPVIETMAARSRTTGSSAKPRKPEFLLIENGRRVLEDKTRRLELIDIGPNPHAKEMVIAWLPAERVVFQGDLFFVPNNDAPFGPPQPSTVSFAKKLKELGLLAVAHCGRARRHGDQRAVPRGDDLRQVIAASDGAEPGVQSMAVCDPFRARALAGVCSGCPPWPRFPGAVRLSLDSETLLPQGHRRPARHRHPLRRRVPRRDSWHHRRIRWRRRFL